MCATFYQDSSAVIFPLMEMEIEMEIFFSFTEVESKNGI